MNYVDLEMHGATIKFINAQKAKRSNRSDTIDYFNVNAKLLNKSINRAFMGV